MCVVISVNKTTTMDFNAWAKSMGLNDKTLQALTREDLNDYDALRAVCEKDLNDLQLTMGMRVMLKKAVAECKRREHADVNYSESICEQNTASDY